MTNEACLSEKKLRPIIFLGRRKNRISQRLRINLAKAFKINTDSYNICRFRHDQEVLRRIQCRMLRQKEKADDSALVGSNRQPLTMRSGHYGFILYFTTLRPSQAHVPLLKAQADNRPVIGGDVLLVPFFWQQGNGRLQKLMTVEGKERGEM